MEYDIANLQSYIEPSVFVPYTWKKAMELSEIFKSGIITNNNQLDELIKNGGTTLNMPAWFEPKGEAQELNIGTKIEEKEFVAVNTIAPMLLRAEGFKVDNVMAGIAGSNPLEKIQTFISPYWMRNFQYSTIATLNGIFASESMKDLVYDGTSKALSTDIFLDAKDLLGDASQQLKIMLMHSRVYTELQRLEKNTSPNAPQQFQLTSFPNYAIVIDDGMPIDKDTGVARIIMSMPGTIGWGKGVPVAQTPDEFARRAEYSTDMYYSRRAFAVGVSNLSWIGQPSFRKDNPTVRHNTPTNGDLAIGTNWERTGEIKSVGMVAVDIKLG